MQAASTAASGRERPRFRQDLVAELIEEPGARFIDVMAPDSGNVFRFYEIEYSLACGMDGERDVHGIVKWAQEELGLTPSQQEVRTVIATLGELGFIDGAEAAAPDPEPASSAAVAPPARPPASPRPERVTPGARPARPTPPSLVATGGSAAVAGAPRPATRPTPVPPPDVALGAPGARPARPTPPSPEPAAPPPAAPPPPPDSEVSSEVSSDVSVDLSDHMAVRPDDVKEAVRASRVMAAVEAPPDPEEEGEVVEMIPEEPTAKGVPSEPEFEPPTESGFDLPESPLGSESAWASESAEALENALGAERTQLPETWVDDRAGKSSPGRPPVSGRPPVELPPPPLPPVDVDKPLPVARSGVSTALIVLLVLVILGAGAYLVRKYILVKATPDAPPTSAIPPPPVTKPAAPPPPAPTAKIALETPEPYEVKLTRAGVIENILTDKTPVKEGDVIVRIVGDKPIEAELAGLARDQKRLQDLIDQATKRRDDAHASGNKAAEAAAQAEITGRQRTLAAKQNQLATKTGDLDNYLIHAPGDGMFSPAAKPGQKVAASAVVATIQRDAVPVATFKVGNTRPFAANAGVEVAIGKGEQRVTCTIADVQPDGVKVTCPVDPALTDGAEVMLNAPAATAPAEPAEPAPGAAPVPAGAPPPAEPSRTAEPAPGTPPAH